jgi:hypothetical protein
MNEEKIRKSMRKNIKNDVSDFLSYRKLQKEEVAFEQQKKVLMKQNIYS